MPWKRRHIAAGGAAVLYLGDCEAIAPLLPRPNAIVSDPPYGQNLKLGGNKGEWNAWKPIVGDDRPFDPVPWLKRAETVLLWGAHHFYPRLPAKGGGWLVWDKRCGRGYNHQGDGEMAWVSRDQVVRILPFFASGAAIEQRGAFDERGQHPTQKPIKVMLWCLDQVRLQPDQVVLDPYMGAGSTGIACMRRGVRFTGIEIEEQYFDAACARIDEAARQPSLIAGPTTARAPRPSLFD